MCIRDSKAWLPLYSLVTFSHTPYHEALQRGRLQQQAMETVLDSPHAWGNFEDDRWMAPVLETLDALIQAPQT